MNENNLVTVQLDKLNILIAALHKAQEKGAFTFEESATVLSNLKTLLPKEVAVPKPDSVDESIKVDNAAEPQGGEAAE